MTVGIPMHCLFFCAMFCANCIPCAGCNNFTITSVIARVHGYDILACAWLTSNRTDDGVRFARKRSSAAPFTPSNMRDARCAFRAYPIYTVQTPILRTYAVETYSILMSLGYALNGRAH